TDAAARPDLVKPLIDPILLLLRNPTGMTGLTGMTSMYDTAPVKDRRVADGGPERAPHRPRVRRRHRGRRSRSGRHAALRARPRGSVRCQPTAHPRGAANRGGARPHRDAAGARDVLSSRD